MMDKKIDKQLHFSGAAVLPDHDNEEQAVKEYEKELELQAKRIKEYQELTSFNNIKEVENKWKSH